MKVSGQRMRTGLRIWAQHGGCRYGRGGALVFDRVALTVSGVLSLIGANLMCPYVTCGQRTRWASPAIAGTSQGS